jgi:CTP synthase (UTP-ammonia lyase)
LIGDFNFSVRAHVAIPKALELAAQAAGVSVTPDWIHTSDLNGQLGQLLRAYDGIWCVPASPYANMDGALGAIRYARENKVPFLGTCGGFQHALIEYARNVRNLPMADHEESNPDAEVVLISRLSCSLVGAKGTIRFAPKSRAASIYEVPEATEEYHCNYGLNPKMQSVLENGPLKISGTDETGQVRTVELDDHPFFVCSLFQPELSALGGKVHRLIVAFVRAVQKHSVQARE